MFVEIRKVGKKKKYYLVHSFRENGKVKKRRRFLGVNLSSDKLEKLKKRAEVLLREQIEFNDPLKSELSKDEINELRKLSPSIKILHLDERQWERFSEVFAYDTNAIEGSTVNLREVEEIIEENKWPQDVEKWEIAETYGVADAIKYIRESKTHLSLELIKKLHWLVFRNSKEFAGKFRPKGVEVAIRDGLGKIVHRGSPSSMVVKLLKELVKWYNKHKKIYPPLVLAVVVHNQFENIHPFQDGNGRVGRLLLNNILLKQNLPLVNIELKNRFVYYKALRAYQDKGDMRPMINLILKEYKNLKHIIG